MKTARSAKSKKYVLGAEKFWREQSQFVWENHFQAA